MFWLWAAWLISTIRAAPLATPPIQALLKNASEQTQQTLYYDPGYAVLQYPGGDVPVERGVCSDVVIRAFRAAGVDLQVLVHRDMKKNFPAYPRRWGLSRPDANIDHRRVANLMKFFERQGKSLAVTQNSQDYRPGDVVAWRLPNGLYHIGLVSDLPSPESPRFLMIHNIGQGARAEDILFAYEILGHYRYF